MAQIKKDTSLRKAILQAAITGQLISDCYPELDSGSPETGKQLLDRIIEERNKKLLAEWEEAVKKNPKAKKPAPVVASEIDEDEIPFEISENWCWGRLGEIAEKVTDFVASGSFADLRKNVKYYEFENHAVLVRTVDFSSEFKKNMVYVDEHGYNFLRNSNLFGGELILPNIGASIGKVFIVPKLNKLMTLGPNSVLVRCNDDTVKMWLLYYFASGIGQNILKEISASTAQAKFNKTDFKLVPIALPPLSVQNAIVAKLEQVLPLVDAYENAVLQKEELKSTLSDKLKKAILQEAITGKLTESWRKNATITETGEQLLERIIKERNAKALAEWEEKVKTTPKAKKPVPVVASEIKEEEIPFEIPESWCWCRLGDLVPFGQCENAEPNEIEDEAWILDLEDIEKDSGKILQFKTKKEVDSKSTKHIFKKGYVLYSKLRPYLNKCVIAPKDGYCTSEILPLNFENLVNSKYAQIFLMSPYFVDYTDSLSFGVKMPRLGTEDGKKALVSLPPLEEQEEIVKKMEELLPLCK